jgi:hypothetical protein
VLVALTAARKPVSAQLLARFAGVAEVARVRAVLTEWAEFLHEGVEHLDGRDVRVYRIYHASFEDFIAAKEEVDDERVSLRDANDRIADDLWAGLYGGPGPAGA